MNASIPSVTSFLAVSNYSTLNNVGYFCGKIFCGSGTVFEYHIAVYI